MDKASFIDSLKLYNPSDQKEKGYKDQFLELLKIENCYTRESLKAHFTASAWVTTPEHDKVLLLHHAKLDRWLQPGGHADGETDLLAVAQKELLEETGVDATLSGQTFFDIDIHTIPEHKSVPEHQHFDVRYHFIVDEKTTIRQNEESRDIKWFKIDKVAEVTGGEDSILRMITKTRSKQKA